MYNPQNGRVSIDHYENFPVASVLCPPAYRAAVVAIYHFARTADDMADEGDATPEQRRKSLADYRQALQHLFDPNLPGPPGGAWPQVFGPLKRAIGSHDLPPAPLHNLLDAFEQDTGNPLHADRDSLLAYCEKSANPVGRLLLHLNGVTAQPALTQADAICTALQLINFWQDLSVDLSRGRHYVPLADLQAAGLTLSDWREGADSPAHRALVANLCAWAKGLMWQGAPLVLAMKGRAGWELRLVVLGGLRILEKIEAMQHTTLRHRPRLNAVDLPGLLWRAWRLPAQLKHRAV